MPVIPVTWEDEGGESLEPRRQRLQWAEIVPLHSSLGNKSEIPSQKKKKEKEMSIKHFKTSLALLQNNMQSQRLIGIYVGMTDSLHLMQSNYN